MTAVLWDASNWDNYFWSGLLSVAAPVGKHVPFTGNIELIKSYQLAFTRSSQRLRVVNPISAFTAMETRSVTEWREMRLRLCERLVYVLIVSIPHNVQNWWLCQFWNGEPSRADRGGTCASSVWKGRRLQETKRLQALDSRLVSLPSPFPYLAEGNHDSASMKPSSRHTTWAAEMEKSSSHTVPQAPL